MTEWVGNWTAGFVSSNATLEHELDQRLAEVAPLAFRVAYSVLRQRQDAEDVAQDALVRAHAHIAELRDRDRFRAWVARIAWRLAIDRRRSGQRRDRREQEAGVEPDAARTPEDLAVARERQERLWRALDELPERLRVVMVLAAIREHELAEVALLLELPLGTVKSRLHEGRKRLAERLR